MDDIYFKTCYIAVDGYACPKNLSNPLQLRIKDQHASELGNNGERYFVVCLRWGTLGQQQNVFAVVEVLDSSPRHYQKYTGHVLSGARDIVLQASPVFVSHYCLRNASCQGFKVKRVRPMQITRATLCAHTDAAYKRLKETNWVTKVLVDMCRQPLILRKNDVVSSEGHSADRPNAFDVSVIGCEPVDQGILTSFTSLTIIRGPKVQLFSQITQSDAFRSRKCLVHFLSVCATVAYLLLLHFSRKERLACFSIVVKILTTAYRILCSCKLHLKVQVLARSPLRSCSSSLESSCCNHLHTVFVSSSVLRRLAVPDSSWALMSVSSETNNNKRKERCVQLCSIEKSAVDLHLSCFGELGDNVCYISPLLWFNLNHHPSCLIQPHATITLRRFFRRAPQVKHRQFAPLHEPPLFARTLRVSLVKSPHYAATINCDNALSEYFEASRLICLEDVFCVRMKDNSLLSSCPSSGELNRSATVVYFRVSMIEVDELTMDKGLLVDRTHSSLYQERTIQSYVPRTMEYFFSTVDLHLIWDSPVPVGFGDSYDELLNLFLPCLKSWPQRRTMSTTLCLVGQQGSGKIVLLSALSKQLNMHLYVVNCWELIGDSVGASSSRIQAVFQKAATYAPCILILKHVHFIGKDGSAVSDGESRILLAFREAFSQMHATCQEFPVIVVGTTSDSALLSSELTAVFLHKIQLKALNSHSRSDVLHVLLKDLNVGLQISMDSIAQKTVGFVLNDLCNLVSRTKLVAHRRILSDTHGIPLSTEDECDLFLSGQSLLQCDLDEAFEELQTEVSVAIGAPKIPNVKWDDIGGLEDVKAEILDTIQLPLQHPELFTSGLRRSGVLLYGPPGTGKTLLAKAVGTECSLNFLSVKGPELINMYVGQSEENVRKIFQLARSSVPCLIFFDELDSLAPNRGRSGDSGGVMDRVVSQLLSEMDGLHRTHDVFIMGATNRPDLIDPALLRPGRFDKLLHVGISTDKASRLKIIKALTKKFHLADNVSLTDIVDNCPPNLTGADYYALCSDAMLNAIATRIQHLDSDLDNKSSGDLIVTSYDFLCALKNLTPSLSHKELQHYTDKMHRVST